MLFRAAGKEYKGESALEIVNKLQIDELDGQTRSFTLPQFLRWSYAQLSDRIPLRELDVSDRLDDEMLALSYLYLRDEFGAGELLGVPRRSCFARPM